MTESYNGPRQYTNQKETDPHVVLKCDMLEELALFHPREIPEGNLTPRQQVVLWLKGMDSLSWELIKKGQTKKVEEIFDKTLTYYTARRPYYHMAEYVGNLKNR